MLESRHRDNPLLYVNGALTPAGQGYMGKLDRLTGVRKLRLRDGIWAAAEGLVYDTFDPALHLIDSFRIPKEWTRYWSIDFGFTNPFVMQWWAEDHDGRLYLYKELYRTQRLVSDHAKDILFQCTRRDGTWREVRPRQIICDHDAEGRATLERELGMGTMAATKTVTDGIQAVQRRLALADDGKPRLFILRDARVDRDESLAEAGKPTSTAEEIVGYVWDQSEGKPPKETPVKADDHGMDALRYLVAKIDLVGKTRVRWL
jgi:phage terminase large subunit